MRILVTGAAGFIGQMVVAKLSQLGSLVVDGREQRIEAILASDISAGPLQELASRHRGVHPIAGALSAPETLARIHADAPELVIHLAAVVSGAAEADFDLGMAVNLQSTVDLINVCRNSARPPVFIFSSSVAVFSCASNDTITDETLPAPRSSYGTQKLICELLIRDVSRKGWISGRALRFPTISVRPGLPNQAASSFASAIIREPMAGKEAALPVGRGLRLHLASPENALTAILKAASLKQSALRLETTITLPGVSVSVGEMIDTLSKVAGKQTAALIKPAPDLAIEAIVASWPGEILAPRARALGFEPDAGFEDLVRHYVAAVRGN